jgi:phytoene/squalene synthetase
LPREVTSRHGFGPEHIAQGEAGSGLARAAEEMAVEAERHLIEARRSGVRPPRRHMAPLLTGAMLPSYLSALKAANYEVASANFERGSLGRTLRVYRNALFRKI